VAIYTRYGQSVNIIAAEAADGDDPTIWIKVEYTSLPDQTRKVLFGDLRADEGYWEVVQACVKVNPKLSELF
jgi:hypothetical protein